MSRSIFGWSYPPGCSGPPDDYEVEQPRCKTCGAYLSFNPTSKEYFESSTQCNGIVDEEGLSACGYAGKNHPPHKEIWDAGELNIFHCRRCGHDTKKS